MSLRGKKRKINDQQSDSAKKVKQSDLPKALPPTAKKITNLSSLILQEDWKTALASEFDKDYFKSLQRNLDEEIKSKAEIFPPSDLIFSALNRTPLNKVKVVLLGQDPYHDEGQAMGLSFSVPHGVNIPPSLNNIFKELATDIPGFKIPSHGCLEKWADQGVLLLNATLTVRAHEANSHSKCGWQKFTDEIIQSVVKNCSGVVFLLWGNFAHKKEKLIGSTRHTVLKFAHPSPLSFGKFKGCKCFSEVNDALKKWGKQEIDWTL